MKTEHIGSSSTIDDFLKIDDDSKASAMNSDSTPQEISSELELDNPSVLTKHTVVTSPWSRLLIIALPFGLTFLAIFWLINGIFNPDSRDGTKITEEPKSSETREQVDQKDGDVYAKLALNQQQDELNKINKNKSEKPETSVVKTERVVEKSPPQPSVQQPQQRTNLPTRTSYQTEPRRSFVKKRANNPTPSKVSVRPIDPTTEFNRLRNIGSYGKIADADTNIQREFLPDPAFVPKKVHSSPIAIINGESRITDIPQENTQNSIEKIRPRWQPQIKTTKPITLANNYLPQESQILQEHQTRYLTVGKFASGVLVTPVVVKQQTDTKNNLQQTSDSRRFVARLTQDIHDNYGDVAIKFGSLLAVEVISVDGGSYAQVQVTSIIKDTTEYPISKGAITLSGVSGKPLMAKKFQDRGGEIAQYDLTLGLVGGLAKVGEILNQPETLQSTQNSTIGNFSSSVSQNNRRDIGGALLNGAFGKLSDIIGSRTEQSTQEILNRPNVWYIPQGTQVTFLVNRTLELP
ncbi:TrbI/VirB10 family protein [Nostoc sp. HG1]|nr:TrbI/VirB10 family protein [Nostoc sp. HG1]